MIIQAQKDLSVNLNRFVLIGDKVSNLQFGNTPGAGANLLPATERSHELDCLNFGRIATQREDTSYLQRGMQ